MKTLSLEQIAAHRLIARLREADWLLRSIDEQLAPLGPLSPLSEDNLEQLEDYLAKYPEPV